MRAVVKIIGDVVANVRAEYDTVDNEKPYYDYGHIFDITDRLQEKTENPDHKLKQFPLILVIQDFPERFDENLINRSVEGLTMFLCTETKHNYKPDERYTNTFENILYPVYELLFKYLKQSTEIDKESLAHEKYDRLFFGKYDIYGNKVLTFNKYIDVIEIIFDKITFLQTC